MKKKLNRILTKELLKQRKFQRLVLHVFSLKSLLDFDDLDVVDDDEDAFVVDVDEDVGGLDGDGDDNDKFFRVGFGGAPFRT